MPLLTRLAERARATVAFTLDGKAADALVGDTVLTAVLTQAERLRITEFTASARAGFCMMGACQDCWILTREGARIRACSTFITPGMDLLTQPMSACCENTNCATSGSDAHSTNEAESSQTESSQTESNAAKANERLANTGAADTATSMVGHSNNGPAQ